MSTNHPKKHLYASNSLCSSFPCGPCSSFTARLDPPSSSYFHISRGSLTHPFPISNFISFPAVIHVTALWQSVWLVRWCRDILTRRGSGSKREMRVSRMAPTSLIDSRFVTWWDRGPDHELNSTLPVFTHCSKTLAMMFRNNSVMIRDYLLDKNRSGFEQDWRCLKCLYRWVNPLTSKDANQWLDIWYEELLKVQKKSICYRSLLSSCNLGTLLTSLPGFRVIKMYLPIHFLIFIS
jgi:hypothetical protein